MDCHIQRKAEDSQRGLFEGYQENCQENQGRGERSTGMLEMP